MASPVKLAHIERKPGPVGQHVDLPAGLAPVHRAGAGHDAPFFARTQAASAIARDQLIRPGRPVRPARPGGVWARPRLLSTG
jgi:hypothetical protein